MTEQPHRPAPHGQAPSLMRATSNVIQTLREEASLVPRQPNRMRRTASSSRPSGRCAVGLRPSLDHVAYLDAPARMSKAKKNDRPTLLTGPAPSGMTCESMICRTRMMCRAQSRAGSSSAANRPPASLTMTVL